MVHMAFCSALAAAIIRLRFVETPTSPPMTRDLYLSSVVPIGALYALSLWFSNSAYIYLSVSFIQMLKALMPVAVYSIDVLIQILLTSKGISLNPITSLYYVAPCCLSFLVVPWILVELPVLRTSSMFRPDLMVFGTNSVCAFALNLAVFLLVGKTSALTMNVTGVVKDWLLIAFSWSVIRDTVTPINLIGYGIVFLGVAYYNHVKLQALKAKEAQKKSAQVDEESGSLLEERSKESSKSDAQS